MPNQLEPKHEADLRSSRGVIFASLGMCVLLTAALLAPWWGGGTTIPASPSSLTQQQSTIPARIEPTVQPNQAYHAIEFQQRLRISLSQYEGIDRQQQTATIPIDRAMEIIASKGVNYYWDQLENQR